MSKDSAFHNLIEDIANGCACIDARGIPHKNFQPGVGPYGEPQLVKCIQDYLDSLPAYSGLAKTKRTPDLLVKGHWAIEFKIARPFGDNGAEAENWSVNLLHPYAGNVSVIGDCLKLHDWLGVERRVAVVVGYEHVTPLISLDPLISSFEAVAKQVLPFQLSARVESRRTGLRHPVHQVVRIIGWEVPTRDVPDPLNR